jgi:hypothetical protein
VLAGLVRGPLVTADVHCDEREGLVTANASVSLQSWLPMLLPDWRFSVHAVAQQES